MKRLELNFEGRTELADGPDRYRRSWRLFRASPDGDPSRLESTSRPADRKRGREGRA
jgi:hypothetical protein